MGTPNIQGSVYSSLIVPHVVGSKMFHRERWERGEQGRWTADPLREAFIKLAFPDCLEGKGPSPHKSSAGKLEMGT